MLSSFGELPTTPGSFLEMSTPDCWRTEQIP
jgi:hypothetical protein